MFVCFSFLFCYADSFALQPTNRTCKHNDVQIFFCVTMGNSDDVVRIDWIVNGFFQHRHHNITLKIHCLPKHNNSVVQCIIHLHGGEVKSDEGWLTVSSSTGKNNCYQSISPFTWNI